MQRLTKAAIATGGAAVLLLGGAGTYAFWTASATATGGTLNSGTLTATGGTCGPWTYVSDSSAVNLIVPGDVVQTDCTVTVSGTGDHLAVTAELDPNTPPAFTGQAALIADLNASGNIAVTSVTDGVGGTALPTTGLNLSDGTTHTLAVHVEVTFPYGDATTTSLNDTQGGAATLSTLTVNVVQVDPGA